MSEPAKTPRYPGMAAIEAYGNGGFRFAGMSHRGSIICLPDAIEAWEPGEVSAVTPDALAAVIALGGKIELLLLGTGRTHSMPSARVRGALAEAGIGLDVMSTGAAARTWNILIAEGRRVAAALIAVD
ncbi:MAG: MTH938/NDUFAF3 family protein [Hyphomicrobiaceae bacterium]|nr:MTH938/NDUFAF3 family protein [Hyphomicrobiaceae bacterium]